MSTFYSDTTLVRYDDKHAMWIEVHPQQDDTASYVRNDLDYFGFKIHTACDPLADLLGLEKESQEEIARAQLRSIAAGDRYYFIEFGDHSCYFVRLSEERPKWDWDSGCVGILVWPRSAWKESFPRRPCVGGCLRPVLDEYVEYLNASLNGWLWEYQVFDADGGFEVCGGDYLSDEAALRGAQDEFPEIKYEEDDFDCSTSYRLIA